MHEAHIRGQKVYEACLSYAAGFFVPPINPEYQGYYQSFKGWFDSNVEVVLYANGILFFGDNHYGQVFETIKDGTFKFQGLPEIVFQLKGKNRNVLGNIMIARSQSKLWKLRLAAHERLITEIGLSIDDRMIIRLKYDGSGVILPPGGNEYDDPRRMLCEFIAHLNVFNFHNNQG